MRRTFPTMGTVASLDLDGPIDPDLLHRIEAIFDDYDRTFSLYRHDSPLSAIARGDLNLRSSPPIVRTEYERAIEWRARTSGWFTPHRPDGVLDLSGTVKAVAIDAAARLLTDVGLTGLIGVGGDLLRLGAGDRRVGIVDPRDRKRLLADPILSGRAAIATSGSAERGDHIWTRLGITDVCQASVLADDIVTADVVATALVAAGRAHLGDLLDALDVDALIVTDDDLLATPRWRATPTLANAAIVDGTMRVAGGTGG